MLIDFVERRGKSSYRTKREDEGQGILERPFVSAGKEERNGAILILDIFDVVAALSRVLALQA